MSANRFNQLDLNLLRVLATIFQQGQLALAADKLAVSPSALSHALRRLREQLDDPLFTRQGRYLVPTNVCSQIAPSIINYLSALESTLSTPQRFDPATAQTTFNIAMPDALESSLLPALFASFSQQAPHCVLRSVPLNRDQLSAQLTRRDVDLVIDVALPVRAPVIHQPLLSDHFVVLSRHGCQLSSMQDYLNQRHVAVSGRAKGLVLEDVHLLSEGLERTISLRCQSYQSAAQIVAASNLLLTVPSLIGHHLARQFNLEYCSLPLPDTTISLRTYWHQQQANDNAIAWLQQLLAALVARVWKNEAGSGSQHK